MDIKPVTITKWIIGVVAVAATLYGFYYLFSSREAEWQKLAKQQADQITALQSANKKQAEVIDGMAIRLDRVEQRMGSIGRTAASGLSEIEKVKKEMEKKDEDMAGLDNAALDRIIRDAVARYRIERGQVGPGADGD